jgi:tRNA(adenine34) deaminase
MNFSEEAFKYMIEALKEAEKAFDMGEVPVGAVIVQKNKIIGRGYNQVETLKDPTAHAEMIAITSAANHLQNWRLNECDIYITMEPCVMCSGALIFARIRSINFSLFDPKFGACGSVYNIPEEGKLNHKPKIASGALQSESEKLLKAFFNNLRD